MRQTHAAFMETIKRETITFEVHTDQVVGVLRRPTTGGLGKGLVFLGPLTSVKEQAAGAYAEAMAKRGYTTLAFDNRSFGQSEGQPRQYEHPPRKVEDVLVASQRLLQESDVDTLGAVGVCAGAGYMSGAVANGPFAAFVGVAGFYHDAQAQRTWLGERYATQLEDARAAREAFERTGKAQHIPAVGHDEDVAMPLEEAFAYYGTPRGAVTNYTNAFAVMSREYTLPWDAQSRASQITIPTLMIHSQNALAPDLARKFYENLAGDKQEIWVESQGQIDFYDDPKLIEPAASRIAEHFAKYMG